jgi:L-ascorbate metabolism protein UlaG (beta-lactamase superfamily)
MNRRTLLKYGAAAVPLTAIPSLITARNNDEANEKTSPEGATMKIQRLAWAGIKVETGKTTLFVDATSEDKDIKLSAETDYNYAVITHPHGDHYDPEALKTVFNKHSLLICHKDAIKWIDLRELRTYGLEMHEPVILAMSNNDIVARPVPAVDGFGVPQVSWIIEGGGKKIIHCGDTLWHGYWWDLGRIYGPFDMAFMPINGARQNDGRNTDEGIPGVLTPQQAVVAAKLLGAKTVCPIHYGSLEQNYFEIPDAEGQFLKAARENNMKVVVLKQGEWVNW